MKLFDVLLTMAHQGDFMEEHYILYPMTCSSFSFAEGGCCQVPCASYLL